MNQFHSVNALASKCQVTPSYFNALLNWSRLVVSQVTVFPIHDIQWTAEVTLLFKMSRTLFRAFHDVNVYISRHRTCPFQDVTWDSASRWPTDTCDCSVIIIGHRVFLKL